MTVTGVVWTTGHQTLGRVYGPGDDGGGRTLVRLTFGILTVWIWVIVVSVVYDTQIHVRTSRVTRVVIPDV